MYKMFYEELLNKVDKGNKVALITYLNDEIHNKNKKRVVLLSEINNELENIQLAIKESFEKGTPTLKDNFLVEPFYPIPRLIIFGGGHVAKPLCELGNNVGFSVTVVDDRPKFANTERFKNADRVICEDFQKSFEILDITNNDFVVIVTRGHKYDGVCLRNAINKNPKYIGMIGSRRRVKAMMSELFSEGFDKESLDNVCSPIGLDIGAVTPYEIAVSIVAELILHRRISKDDKSKKIVWPEFDRDVLESIATKSQVQRALVTIISSKGSVPRGAGSKMIVGLDGSTIGSIGGGCSEASIITTSRNVIREGKYSIEHVDMTGEVAEDAGMVCGGVIDVLIEPIDKP